MSTVFADISSALDTRLNALSGNIPTAWENTAFIPTKDVLYLRPSLLPAPTIQAALGVNGIDEYIGIYQIDIFAPAGKGRGEAEIKADSVADHFKRGTDLSSNGKTIRLGNVSRNAGIRSEDRFIISISINYMAHVTPR